MQKQIERIVRRAQFYQSQADAATAKLNQEIERFGFPPIDNRKLTLTPEDIENYVALLAE